MLVCHCGRNRNVTVIVEVHTGVHGGVPSLVAVFGVRGKEGNGQEKGLMFGSILQKLRSVLFVPLGDVFDDAIAFNIVISLVYYIRFGKGNKWSDKHK